MLRRTISILVMLVIAGAIAIVSSSPATAAAKPAAAAVQRPAAAVQHSSTIGPYPLRCVVTASNVNYRRGPGTQYASFGQVNRGFAFNSDGGIPNPRSRYQYWNNVERAGRADAYIDSDYTYCWLR